MKNAYLDVFPAALTQILNEIGFDKVDVEDSDKAFEESTEIIASVGITGAMQGFMMLSASLNSAKNFVDRMMLNIGMEIEEEGFGQFHKEATGELVNQFSGRAVMILHEKQSIDCNITPPTIVTGSNIYADMTDLAATSIKSIKGDFGNVRIFTGIKQIF